MEVDGVAEGADCECWSVVGKSSESCDDRKEPRHVTGLALSVNHPRISPHILTSRLSVMRGDCGKFYDCPMLYFA
jgi:hypothetical protein